VNQSQGLVMMEPHFASGYAGSGNGEEERHLYFDHEEITYKAPSVSTTTRKKLRS